MRRSNCLFLPFTALLSAAALLPSSPLAVADNTRHSAPAAECQNVHGSTQPLTSFAGLATPAPITFDVTDQQAALESVQFALSSIGDGSSYVWHRGHGKLSGLIQPTQSFKDPEGKICRHFIVTFSSGTYSKRTETVACRMSDGIWQLDG